MHKDPRVGLAAIAAAILIVSLAVKFIVLQGEEPPQPASAAMLGEVRVVLATEGYHSNLIEDDWVEQPMIVASKGDCTLFLRDGTLDGLEYEKVARRRLNEGRTLRYFVDGKQLDTFPRLSSEWRWRMQRELAAVGIAIDVAPVIAVAARPECWPDPKLLKHVRLRTKLT